MCAFSQSTRLKTYRVKWSSCDSLVISACNNTLLTVFFLGHYCCLYSGIKALLEKSDSSVDSVMSFCLEPSFNIIDLRLFIHLSKLESGRQEYCKRCKNIELRMCFKINLWKSKENNWPQFIVFCCYLQVEMYKNYYNSILWDKIHYYFWESVLNAYN